MVSASTLEIINLTTDININYNIKLFLMISMWLYFAFIFWASFKLDGDRFFVKAWRILSRVIAFPYLVFAPMFIFFLLRTVIFETLYLYMMAFYGIFLVVWFILTLLAIGEYGMYILGFNLTPKVVFEQLSTKTPFHEDFVKK